MKIEILKGKYVIEEDRNGYILSEWKKSKKGANKGELYISDQVFPATLSACFERIIHTEKRNKPLVLQLEKLDEAIREINEHYLEEFKNIKWSTGKEKKWQ